MEHGGRRRALPEGIWALHTPPSAAAESANEHVVAWARSRGLVRSAAAQRRLAQVRLGDFAARVYPTATFDELLLVTDWIAWLDFVDDQNDDGAAALAGEPSGFELFLARLAEAGLHTGAGDSDSSDARADAGPLGEALADLWDRTRDRAGARLCRRLRGHLHEYLTGNVQQVAYRALGDVCDPVEYPALRRAAGGIAVTFDLIEIAGGAELAPQVYYSRAYQRLLTAAGDVVCWTNDILTVEKETAAGDLLNLVVVIEAAERCTRDQALARAGELTAERLDDFHRAERELPGLCAALGLSETDRRGLASCVALLRAWICGHAEWGLTTSRYAAPPADTDWLEELMVIPADRREAAGA
jgi:hypothetical protein